MRSNLRENGADLIVRVGKPEAVVPRMVTEYGIDAIHAHKEVAGEEVQVEENLANSTDVPIEGYHKATLFHPGDIPYDYDSIPKVFTNFRNQELQESGIELGVHFPEPMIDLEASYREIRNRE